MHRAFLAGGLIVFAAIVVVALSASHGLVDPRFLVWGSGCALLACGVAFLFAGRRFHPTEQRLLAMLFVAMAAEWPAVAAHLPSATGPVAFLWAAMATLAGAAALALGIVCPWIVQRRIGASVADGCGADRPRLAPLVEPPTGRRAGLFWVGIALLLCATATPQLPALVLWLLGAGLVSTFFEVAPAQARA